MSREHARVKALQEANRLKQVLQSDDRIELFGYAIAKSPGGDDAATVESSAGIDDLGASSAATSAVHRIPSRSRDA